MRKHTKVLRTVPGTREVLNCVTISKRPLTPEPLGSGLLKLEAPTASWKAAPANQSQDTAPPAGNMDLHAGAPLKRHVGGDAESWGSQA